MRGLATCTRRRIASSKSSPRKNQTAHEVTRDVTAWACQWALVGSARHTRGRRELHRSCASRPLVSGRCCRQITSGLGPPRPAQRGRLLAVAPTQTVAREPSFAAAHPRWGGGAVSRLDGRGISLFGCRLRGRAVHGTHRPQTTSRTLLLEDRAPFAAHSWPALARWVRRTADRGTLSPRGGEHRVSRSALRRLTNRDTRLCVTGGDSNPIRLPGPFEPISSGWPQLPFRVSSGITPRSLAAGSRPARTCLLRRAIADEKPDSVTEVVLQFRRALSCPTTNGNIRVAPATTKEIRKTVKSYPPRARKR
jgi:hypothetical protein